MTVTVATNAATSIRASLLAAACVTAAFAAVPARAEGPTDSWIKVCRTDERAKKELCKTAFDLRTTGGQFLASVSVVEISGEARKILEMIMPTNLLLQQGLKVQIDQNKAEDAKYTLCASDGCASQLTVTDAFVATMKKGTAMSIVAYGPAGNPVTFSVPLGSFAGANEGKPLDEAALRKREEAIRNEVQQKQQSIEEQLRAEQHKAQQGN